MEEKAPDHEYVERCLRGDLEAFGTLVDRYQRPVFRAVWNMVGDYEDAREITQQVFLKSFEHLAGFDRERKFFSWIYRIAMNESINHVKARRPFVPIDDVPPELLQHQSGEDASRDRAVRQSVAALKEDFRAVIVLRHFLGHSYEEVAEVLQLPVKTVRSRLFEARKALRSALAPLAGPVQESR